MVRDQISNNRAIAPRILFCYGLQILREINIGAKMKTKNKVTKWVFNNLNFKNNSKYNKFKIFKFSIQEMKREVKTQNISQNMIIEG